ncbi:hypothetical protein C5167_028533 [Papaver somniferum]|uniref:uncharacterized protein LOC113338391 n=1 Tax=Papaver somniferum TaxID=3469 RepID=UPI000E6F46E0|nr:uncharacterized protein LOC113338391 [Papaver somniferum]RZC90700.1 hypothetical protein C5167_028533 [Papaver somniferum]
MDMDLSENQHMIFEPLSAEQIATNEKKMNMTLDDIVKMSRKTAGSNPRKPRPYLNRRRNVPTVGGNFSNVWSLRESKPSTKHNRKQKFPSAGAPLRNSTSVWSCLKVSKPSVRQSLPTQRYLNLQDNQHIVRAIATNVQPATTRTRPLIRNKMPNLSNSRAGVSPVQERRFAEKKQKWMKWQNQVYSAQKFGAFCARKTVVPHSQEYYEY